MRLFNRNIGQTLSHNAGEHSRSVLDGSVTQQKKSFNRQIGWTCHSTQEYD